MSKESVALLRVAISGLLVLGAMFWIVQRRPALAVGSYLFTFFLFTLSLCISTENKEAILNEGVRFTLCICIPVFLSAASIDNEQIFHKICYKIFQMCAIVGILYGVLFLTGKLPMAEKIYNMSYGYGLMLPTMYFIHKNCFTSLLTSFILFMFILLCGSRGALIPILFYFLWKEGIIGSSKKRIILFISLIIGIIMLPFMLNYLGAMGIDSRTIYLLVNGEIGSSSGRDDIYTIMNMKISESPFIGYGVFGDRAFLDGSYCHSIIYELLIDFGLFLPILFLLISLIYIYDLISKIDSFSRDIIVLFCFASLLPLIASNSYLIDFRLFLFLGILFYYKKKSIQKIFSRNY